MKNRMASGILVCVGCLLATGCSGSPSAHTPGKPVTASVSQVRDGKELSNWVGQRIELEGRAANAKMGPVIMLEDGIPIYLEGRVEWAPPLVGTRVYATGIVVKHAGLHDPYVGGIQDDYFTIHDPSVKDLSPEK